MGSGNHPHQRDSDEDDGDPPGPPDVCRGPGDESTGHEERGRRSCVGELAGRLDHQTPGKADEQDADRQLHSTDERLGKDCRSAIEQTAKPERDEYQRHEQRPGRDDVRAEPLGDGDRSEGLERLHRNRQTVEPARGHIEQAGRQQHRAGREPVNKNERHDDRDEHAEVSDGTGDLAAVQLLDGRHLAAGVSGSAGHPPMVPCRRSLPDVKCLCDRVAQTERIDP